jgi:diadenosine tetraphosphate (Ap4A) HIT family hydrolase
MKCELCEGDGGELVWRDSNCRVVLVSEPDYPGFCRAIWNAHVKEMTDLGLAERDHLMSVVFAVESALREAARPDKINLASLGNATPHLHWHVIPRFRGDPHFPNPVWGATLRLSDPAAAAARTPATLRKKLAEKLRVLPLGRDGKM